MELHGGSSVGILSLPTSSPSRLCEFGYPKDLMQGRWRPLSTSRTQPVSPARRYHKMQVKASSGVLHGLPDIAQPCLPFCPYLGYRAEGVSFGVLDSGIPGFRKQPMCLVGLAVSGLGVRALNSFRAPGVPFRALCHEPVHCLAEDIKILALFQRTGLKAYSSFG